MPTAVLVFMTLTALLRRHVAVSRNLNRTVGRFKQRMRIVDPGLRPHCRLTRSENETNKHNHSNRAKDGKDD
jgi:hypothetical protein